jgi:hypothetical protein
MRTLRQKLPNGRSPQEPKDYRNATQAPSEPTGYTLSYEKELHLGNQFAFIAHAASIDSEYVSAITLEEHKSPPGYTLRLAANQTPKPYVQTAMSKICSIIREHAEAGE